MVVLKVACCGITSRAANTTNLNDSDPDLVEFEGKVLLVGNWGDQRTTPTNSLYQARNTASRDL